MQLPVMPPVSPMLAKAISGIPDDDGLLFEPKWDGFRCIVFKDGDEIELGSRNERPMNRYFPEVIEALRAQLPPRCVVDGEIILPTSAGLDFDALGQRIHPAASRVKLLSEQTPASFVAFDILAIGDEDLRELSFAERRARLESALAGVVAPVHVTPVTNDRVVAEQWFHEFEGAKLEGLIAKPSALPYQENKRVMFKIKHSRSADCVVAGFRWHKSGPIIGSLLLGLFDDDGNLHHLGITSSFTMVRRKEIVDEIAPYRVDALDGHPWAEWASMGAGEGDGKRRPGAVSRWNAKKDLSWEPLRPALVCEVAYDYLQNNRFRHATTFRRWRPDRLPESCTYSQLEAPMSGIPEALSTIFA